MLLTLVLVVLRTKVAVETGIRLLKRKVAVKQLKRRSFINFQGQRFDETGEPLQLAPNIRGRAGVDLFGREQLARQLDVGEDPFIKFKSLLKAHLVDLFRQRTIWTVKEVLLY